MYVTDTMRQRTNIYLDKGQLLGLKTLGRARKQSVAELVRQAVDDLLQKEDIQSGPRAPADWEELWSQWDKLIEKRDRVQKEKGFSPEEVDRDVMAAVREVREEKRRARGH